MKRIIVGVVMGAFALGLAAPLAAQNSKDEIKKRILKKVEDYLKAEEDRILKEIEKIIDEELGLTSKTPKEKKPGFVGINIGDLSDEDRQELGLEEGEGVMVTMVMEDMPAAKAGLQEGDVVLSVGEKKVGASQALIDEIKKAGAGETVTLKILRGDEEKEIKVTLAERPEEQPEAPPTPPDRNEEPKQDEGARERMRERIREFMKKERPADEAPPKVEEPREDGAVDDLLRRIDRWLASEEVQKAVAQALDKIENAERYLEKDERGVWRLTEQIVDLLRGRLEKIAPEDLDAQMRKMKEYVENQFDVELPELPGGDEAAPESGNSGFLGIMVDEIDDSVRAQFDIEEGVGVVVTAVKDGSPAGEAGVKPHDLVLKIDGQWVRGEVGLAKAMKRAAAGRTIEMTVLSGGKEKTVKATLAVKP